MKKMVSLILVSCVLLVAISTVTVGADTYNGDNSPSYIPIYQLRNIPVGTTWTSTPHTFTMGEWNGHQLVWRVLEVSHDPDNDYRLTAFVVLDGVLANISGTAFGKWFSERNLGVNLFDNTNSIIKPWLNGEFFHNAFSSDMRDAIIMSNFTLGGIHPTNASNTGSSHIFLLSCCEIQDPRFFENQTDRIAHNIGNGAVSTYWLRSTGTGNNTRAISATGGIWSPTSAGSANPPSIQVRPVMKINLEDDFFNPLGEIVHITIDWINETNQAAQLLLIGVLRDEYGRVTDIYTRRLTATDNAATTLTFSPEFVDADFVLWCAVRLMPLVDV